MVFLSLSTQISATRDTDFQLQIDQGRIQVTGLAIGDGVPDPVMLHADTIVVDDVALDLLKKNVTVGSVSCDGIVTHQWRDQTGKFRYERLISDQGGSHEPGGPTAPSETPQATSPWSILVKQIGINNGAVNFSDQNQNITVDHGLSGLTLALENVSLTPKAPVTAQFFGCP